jgi:hypothetical protein
VLSSESARVAQIDLVPRFLKIIAVDPGAPFNPSMSDDWRVTGRASLSCHVSLITHPERANFTVFEARAAFLTSPFHFVDWPIPLLPGDGG